LDLGFALTQLCNIPHYAGLTIATIPIVVVYLLGQRYFIRGMVSGAVK